MEDFATTRLPALPVGLAPDGTAVRPLVQLAGGSMAHFELAPNQTSIAVTHRTVEEIWYVLHGRGEMWRKQADREEVVSIESGVSLTVPLGTHFQFRSVGDEPLVFIIVTMPPWPGAQGAFPVRGKWQPTVNLG